VKLILLSPYYPQAVDKIRLEFGDFCLKNICLDELSTEFSGLRCEIVYKFDLAFSIDIVSKSTI